MSDYNNKVVLATGEVLMDLSADTIAPANVTKGITFHDGDGAPQVGTSTKDLDTSKASAKVGEVIEGATFGARGAMMTGTAKNNGAVHLNVDSTGRVKIPQGFHDGSGDAGLSSSDISALDPSNVREGVEYMGKTGTLKVGTDEKVQNKTVTPSFTAQEITPDEGFTCMRKVTVNAIKVTRTPNAAGGNTVTIG